LYGVLVPRSGEGDARRRRVRGRGCDAALTPADLAIAAYERAIEPKSLVILPGGHFDAYMDGFDQASAAARDWFTQHLLQPQRIAA
jgi:fermentation-respiration switch protein FrsA (DUF1100 family)